MGKATTLMSITSILVSKHANKTNYTMFRVSRLNVYKKEKMDI